MGHVCVSMGYFCNFIGQDKAAEILKDKIKTLCRSVWGAVLNNFKSSGYVILATCTFAMFI